VDKNGHKDRSVSVRLTAAQLRLLREVAGPKGLSAYIREQAVRAAIEARELCPPATSSAA